MSSLPPILLYVYPRNNLKGRGWAEHELVHAQCQSLKPPRHLACLHGCGPQA